MLVMNLTVGVLLTYCSIIFANGKLSFNFSTATDQCKGLGNLASYKYVIQSIRNTNSIHDILDDGESAWISGNVKYSEFVTLHGCFKQADKFLNKTTLLDNNVYNCLEFCKVEPEVVYIGLQKNVCFCLSHGNIVTVHAFSVSQQSSCEPQLLGPSFKITNLLYSDYVYIYAIIYKSSLVWNQHESQNVGQCVYIQKNFNKSRFTPDSCYSQIDGFICTHSVNQELNKSCKRFYQHSNLQGYSPEFCIVSRSSDWPTSFNECEIFSGKLIHNVDSRIQNEIQENNKYWTGIFRSYRVQEKDKDYKRNKKMCLSVRRLGMKIVLEPASCSVKKSYICKDSLARVRENTTVIFNKRTEESDSPVHVYVPVGIILFTLVSSVICLVIFRTKIWSRLQMDRNTRTLTRESTAIESQAVSYENVQNVQTLRQGRNFHYVPTGGRIVIDGQVYETLGDRRSHENYTYQSMK